MKIVFCNIGWMKHYQGQTSSDEIEGGGDFVKENKTGFEVNNYRSINGKCYGYVRKKGRMDLGRISSCSNLPKHIDYIDGIYIIWTAKDPKPNGKSVVVGWYKNARVFLNKQNCSENVNQDYYDEKGDYWFEANSNDCILLPISERKLRVPRNGPGLMGTTSFWYGDSKEGATFVEDVKKFINKYDGLLIENNTIKDDLDKIAESNENETTKKKLVDARLGQGQFRKNLLRLYPVCPVTEIELGDLLKASHIKPWRESDNEERLDKFNGVMLAAHVDALFDKGYISFQDDGSLLISSLCLSDINKLHIDKNIKIKIYDESKKYLQWHREYIFMK